MITEIRDFHFKEHKTKLVKYNQTKTETASKLKNL